MKPPARKNLAARRVVFAILLAVIAILVAQVVYQNRPWTVPAAAKQVPNPLQPSDAALKSARSTYLDKCARCHGDSGKGDGRDAFLHNPSPSNFTDAKHMSPMTDGEMFYKISEGRKPMPSFQDRLTAEQRWQLVLLIRSFAAPAAPTDAR